jgi:hypothetical protein
LKFSELNHQEANYQVWLKNFQAKTAATIPEGMLKKYGKHPVCNRLLTALEELRRSKQTLYDSGHSQKLDALKNKRYGIRVNLF